MGPWPGVLIASNGKIGRQPEPCSPPRTGSPGKSLPSVSQTAFRRSRALGLVPAYVGSDSISRCRERFAFLLRRPHPDSGAVDGDGTLRAESDREGNGEADA